MTAPNIILLVVDDMAIEQLQRMPQVMKRLAATGVNFGNAFVATPQCQPARATLLTGQYAHNHAVIENATSYLLCDAATMLQRRLQLAGYRTGHVGKYLNTYVTADGIPAGWDEWHATIQPSYFNYNINDNGAVTAKGAAPADYGTTVCTDRAVTFISTTTQPFFLQVGYFAPHFDNSLGFYQITPEPSYKGTVPGANSFPQDPNFNVAIAKAPAYLGSFAAIDGATINSINAYWRGQTEALFSVDRSVQAIMDALVTAGKTNTVVIIVSDNGYYHGEHRDPTEKIAPYWPASRVPLIIAGPASLVAQGKTCGRLVSQVDIAATIYALTGATSTRALDGVSLLPLLADPAAAALRNYLLVEWLGTVGRAGAAAVTVPIYHSVMSEAFAYGLYATGERELYDRAADPGELVNVIDEHAHGADQAALAAALATLQSCSGGNCVVM